MDLKKEVSNFWNTTRFHIKLTNQLESGDLLDFKEQIKLHHFRVSQAKPDQGKKLPLSPLLPVKFDDLFFLPVDCDLKELFNSNSNVFLVGAGISRNSPSNIPTANEIVKIFLDSIIPGSLKEFFDNPASIRYDVLMYMVKKYTGLSNDLFQFFSEYTHPNTIHFFLAKALINGAIVVTTNYDNLIEMALYTLLPESEHKNIIIISKIENDINQWKQIKQLKEKGKILLIKLHGTFKEMTSEADLSETIVADTGQILQDREFEIIDYDRGAILDLLEFIIKPESNVITMGYSGGDVLDIAHALNNLTLKKLIWLEHNPSILDRKNRVKSNSVLKFGAQNYLDNIIQHKGLCLKYIGFSFHNLYTLEQISFHLNYVDRIFTNSWPPKQEKIKIICHTTEFVENGLGKILFGENFTEEIDKFIKPTKRPYDINDFVSRKFIDITEDQKLLIAANLASQTFKPNKIKKISERIYLEFLSNDDFMKKERSELKLKLLFPMICSLLHYRIIEDAEKLLSFLIANPMEFINLNPQSNEIELLIIAQYSSLFYLKNEFKKCIQIFDYLFQNIDKSDQKQCVQLFHDFFSMDKIYDELSKHELIENMYWGISPFPTMFEEINDMDTMIKAQYIQSAYQMRRGRFQGPNSALPYAYNVLDIITGFAIQARYIYVYDIFVEEILQNDSIGAYEYAPILLFDVLNICKDHEMGYWMDYFMKRGKKVLENIEKYHSLNSEENSDYIKLIIHDLKSILLKFS